MREYEVIVIYRADLEEDALKQLVQRVQDWLPRNGSEKEPVVNEWGRRTLAYPIQKVKEGYYVMFEAELDPQGLSEMEQNMTYVDEILRHLVVRKEG